MPGIMYFKINNGINILLKNGLVAQQQKMIQSKKTYKCIIQKSYSKNCSVSFIFWKGFLGNHALK